MTLVLYLKRMCTIHVDARETRLYEALVSNVGQSSPFTVISAQLDIGDVTMSCPGVLLIFERKTGADLTASVKDGRYREQKRRMASATSPKHVTYFIENVASCGLSESVLNGVIVNTMYRDGMHVMFTKNTQETATWLLTIASKLAVDPSKYQTATDGGTGVGAGASGGGVINNEPYINSVKIKSRKIENIDIKTCYLLQLGQIPGVSQRIAESIFQAYPTMYVLLRELHDSPEPVKLLTKLPLIGEKKAKTIHDFLLNKAT